MEATAVKQKRPTPKQAAPDAALLRAWIEANAKKRGDAPYVVSLDQGVTVSHRDLAEAVARMATCLADAGIGSNDRVAMLANNCVEHLIAYVGVMACGATICTVHVETNQAHLTDILRALNPRMVLIEEGLGLDLPEEAAPEAEWLSLGDWGSADDRGLMGRLRAVRPQTSVYSAASPDWSASRSSLL